MQIAYTESLPLEDLHSIDELAAKFPKILSVPTLRWQLRHRKENGLATACVPVGKKLLISKTRYESWLATRSERDRLGVET
jgi:hypothetical protein